MEFKSCIFLLGELNSQLSLFSWRRLCMYVCVCVCFMYVRVLYMCELLELLLQNETHNYAFNVKTFYPIIQSWNVFPGLFIALLNAQQEEIAGSTVTLAFPLQGSFTYPTWSGPPGSTGYIREGQETSPNYPWVAYAENKKDLLISDVKPEFSGDYICEKDEFGSSIISLSVIGNWVLS